MASNGFLNIDKNGYKVTILETEDGTLFPASFVHGVSFPPHHAHCAAQLKILKIKENDVFVVGYPKSGSHWVNNVVSMILGKKYFKGVICGENLPYYYLHLHDVDTLDKAPGPRIIATHVFPDFLPELHKAKLIYIARNPKDVITSAYYYYKNVRVPTLTLAATVELFLNGKLWYGCWFDHISRYDTFLDKNHENGLKIVYENLLKEPYDEIKRLANFLEVDLTNDDVAVILQQSSVENMRSQHEGKKDPQSVCDHAIYRKGIIGDWKNVFTVALNELFNDEYKKRTKYSQFHFEIE